MPKRDGGFLDMSDGMERLRNWASGKNANPNPSSGKQATKQQWNDYLASSKPAAPKPKPKAKGAAKKKVAMKPMKRGMKNAKKK
jgi:hypothetical protein